MHISATLFMTSVLTVHSDKMPPKLQLTRMLSIVEKVIEMYDI